MEIKSFALEGRACGVITDGAPEALLLQPGDESDLNGLNEEFDFIRKNSSKRAALAFFRVEDWFSDLSPWDAPPAFGTLAFGHGASETLKFITDALKPKMFSETGLAPDAPCVIGGYSLAGLFALWAGYETNAFGAAAAASPSVWLDGWLEYAQTHAPKAGKIYLSLGDREEHAKNPTLARVGDCIRKQFELLKTDIGESSCALEWNPGNHFSQSALRTAKAFAWCLNAL